MRLTLENFRIFGGRTELTFSDTGVTLLSAPSGTGKTTVLDAIEFVLFNAPSSTTVAGNYENPRTRTTAVTLEIGNVRVKRTRRPNTVTCTFTDTGVQLVEQECEEAIRRIFGYRLTDPIRDVVLRISGCDDYDTYVQGVKDYGKIQRSELQRLTGELEGYERMQCQIPSVAKPTKVNNGPRPQQVDVKAITGEVKRLEDLHRGTRDGLSLMKFKLCAIQQELQTTIEKKNEEEAYLFQLAGSSDYDHTMKRYDVTRLNDELNAIQCSRSRLHERLVGTNKDLDNAWANVVTLCEQIDIAKERRGTALKELRMLGYREDDELDYDPGHVEATEKHGCLLKSQLRQHVDALTDCDDTLSKLPHDCVNNVRWPTNCELIDGKCTDYETAKREYQDTLSVLRQRWQSVKSSLLTARDNLSTALKKCERDFPHVSCDNIESLKHTASNALRKRAERYEQRLHDYLAAGDDDGQCSMPASFAKKILALLRDVRAGRAVEENVIVELYEAYSNSVKLECELKNVKEAIEVENERLEMIDMLSLAFTTNCKRYTTHVKISQCEHSIRSLPDTSNVKQAYRARSTVSNCDDVLRECSSRLKAYLRKRDDLYVECAEVQRVQTEIDVRRDELADELSVMNERNSLVHSIEELTKRVSHLNESAERLNVDIAQATVSVHEQSRLHADPLRRWSVPRT
uniref:Putative myosine-like protein n=1 Tax=Spodoptera frugiperda ascovirus 1a TaxID=113370 RepID=Q8JJY4_SFAVA|nr:putative myosine-like protein [Spodoptera frugiperda ascovirus 1a]